MPTVPNDRPGSDHVDLTGQISSGDDITGEIQDAIADDTRVFIPGGEYDGSFEDLLDISADNATLYGDPNTPVNIEMDYDGEPTMAPNGHLRIENINVRGQKPLEQYKINVQPDGGLLEWVNFNHPDGTDSPTDSYVARCDGGSGEHHIINCYIGPHGNSAFYYSERDHDDMPVLFDGCGFQRSAGPWRGGNAVIRNCLYYVNDAVPDFKEPGGDPGGPGTPRLVKQEGGGETVIESTDVYFGPNGDASGADGPCVDWGPEADDSNTVVVRNSRFANHIDREVFDTCSAPSDAVDDSQLQEGVSIVTSPAMGDCGTIPGDYSTDDPPAQNIDDWRWTPIENVGDPTGPGGDGTRKQYDTVGLWQAGGPDNLVNVELIVNGDVQYGGEAERGTDILEDVGNGKVRVVSVHLGPGSLSEVTDNWRVHGFVEEVNVTVDDGNPPSDYTIGYSIDGEEVTRQELLGATLGNPEGQPPSPDFTFSPTQPKVDDEVTFDASASTDPDGNIASYEWNIGGVSRTGEVVTVTFDSEGEYSAELTVTDDTGLSESVSKSVTVGSAPPGPMPPTAEFAIRPSNPVVGEQTAFDASGSSDPDGSIQSYDWTINGRSLSGQVAHRTFNDSGTYDVMLTVTDNDGQQATAQGTVTVEDRDGGGAGGIDRTTLLLGAGIAASVGAAYASIKSDRR